MARFSIGYLPSSAVRGDSDAEEIEVAVVEADGPDRPVTRLVSTCDESALAVVGYLVERHDTPRAIAADFGLRGTCREVGALTRS